MGVDVGGTFTDLALYDPDSNSLEFAKVPSTPADQTEGVILGLQELLGRTGVPASDVTNFIHGTTVAINTLLERKGARTALITTAGVSGRASDRTSGPPGSVRLAKAALGAACTQASQIRGQRADAQYR